MAKGVGAGLIDPRYCCCAVPLVNAGIYGVIMEQGVLALAVGICAIATPDVVGTSFPSFANYIFAVTCFLVAACQPLGWIGVLREKTSTFKAYAWANTLCVIACFSVAAALIAVSASRHTTAVAECRDNFFTSTNSTSTQFASASNSTLNSQAQALCSPFAWADVGIMGGLWVILLLVQGYFIYLTKVYSSSQVSDHKLYHSVYSENPEAFTMSVLRSTRYNPNSMYNAPSGPNADAWDARPSTESLRDDPKNNAYYTEQAVPGGYGQGSMYNDQHAAYGEHHDDGSRAQPNTYEGYQNQQHAQYEDAPPYGHSHSYSYGQNEGSSMYPNAGYPHTPEHAVSRDPGDTPTMPHYSDGQGVGYAGDGGLRRPDGIQNHPGRG